MNPKSEQYEICFNDIEVGDIIVNKNGVKSRVVMFNNVLCAEWKQGFNTYQYTAISIVRAWWNYTVIKGNIA